MSAFNYLVKNLFLNDYMKDILPIVVSILFFMFIKAILLRLVTYKNKNINDFLIDSTSIIFTLFTYLSFIEVVGLARHDYILDFIPLLVLIIRNINSFIKELCDLSLLLLTANVTSFISIFKMFGYHNISMYVTYILSFFRLYKLKISLICNKVMKTKEEFFVFITNKYNLNCSYSC